MSKRKQIKLCVDTEYPPTCEGFIAIVDEETRGRLFYEEVSDKDRAERFVKCWNSHDALLAACDEGLHECERVKMHCTCKHKDLGGLLKRIERIEAAIAEAKKGLNHELRRT